MTDVVETPSDETLEPALAPEAALAAPVVPVVPVNPDLRWYVVHAYSGMEKAVERNITERITRAGMQAKFGRILVPMEEVVEIKNGQKKTTERKFFPGYVLVEMIMDDDTWHLVKHTNKVTGFVGGAKNRPSPISEAEVMKIVHQMQEGTEKPRHKVELVVWPFFLNLPALHALKYDCNCILTATATAKTTFLRRRSPHRSLRALATTFIR